MRERDERERGRKTVGANEKSRRVRKDEEAKRETGEMGEMERRVRRKEERQNARGSVRASSASVPPPPYRASGASGDVCARAKHS